MTHECLIQKRLLTVLALGALLTSLRADEIAPDVIITENVDGTLSFGGPDALHWSAGPVDRTNADGSETWGVHHDTPFTALFAAYWFEPEAPNDIKEKATWNFLVIQGTDGVFYSDLKAYETDPVPHGPNGAVLNGTIPGIQPFNPYLVQVFDKGDVASAPDAGSTVALLALGLVGLIGFYRRPLHP